jgi:hypothetical protein
VGDARNCVNGQGNWFGRRRSACRSAINQARMTHLSAALMTDMDMGRSISGKLDETTEPTVSRLLFRISSSTAAPASPWARRTSRRTISVK